MDLKYVPAGFGNAAFPNALLMPFESKMLSGLSIPSITSFSPSVFNNAWTGRTDIAKGNETTPNTAAQPNDLMTGSCVIGRL